MRAATLTGHLSRWPDHRLERLLVLRADLCHPPVPDFAALAARASTQMSVLRALDGLDRAHLDVLEALGVLSQLPDAGPTLSPDRLAAFLSDGSTSGTAGARAEIVGLCGGLAEAALVVGHDGGWQLPVPVSAALGPHPLAFGRSATVLGSAPFAAVPAQREVVLALLRNETGDDDLLACATAALDALQSSPVARIPEPPGPVHDLLLRTGLLIPTTGGRTGSGFAEHPLEAGLAWRNGTAGRSVHAAPSSPTGRSVSPALSRNAALAAIGDLLRGASDLLTALADGLPTLRSGGIGVRELKKLSDATGAAPEGTAWLLELLAAAGLVVLDPDTSRWVPASETSAWHRSERHVQWEALVLGWLRSGRAPMLGPAVASPVAGSGPPNPGPPNPGQASGAPSARPDTAGGRALASDRNRPDAPRLRAHVLETALEISDEHPGIALDRAVPERQHWRSPRQFSRTAPFTAPLLAEAGRLGLAGAGALTPAGALVAAGRLDEAAAAVGNALPPPLTMVRLQGDLTAVAPGYLDPEVTRRLAAMAEVEGDGAARVYRFSDASLHRALDAGLRAEEIEAFLESHSEDEIPQSLRYLVRDVARRHGVLAVGGSGAWLRSEDPDLLDVIVADPAMVPARLERLAPTVVVAGVGQDELHRMLAAAGHRAAYVRAGGQRSAGPTGETVDGGPAGTAARTRRSARPGASSGIAADLGLRAEPLNDAFPEPVRAVRWVPSEEELAAQIARLRSAPQPTPSGPGTEEAIAVLRHAARHRTEVDLVTVDQRGRRQSRRVVPLAVAGGRVRCLVPDRKAETVVPLHRVVSATPTGHPGVD